MTPDEDSLVKLCVFAPTLSADLELARIARTSRAPLTSGYALAPYSTPAPFQFDLISSARPSRGALFLRQVQLIIYQSFHRNARESCVA